MTSSAHLILCLLLFLPPLAGMAQNDSPNLGDHPLLDRFPDSELEDIEVLENVNYRLVLGSLQRSRQEVVPENSIRLRGDVSKLIYEVPQQFSGEEAFDFFRQQIADKGYTVLYTCSGRACGSSNYWANDIFQNRILYGPERNQYFMALRVGDDAEPRAHISIYIITRGNRRIYTYIEILEEDVSRGVVSIASPGLLQSLNAQGSVALPAVSFSDDSELAPGSDLASAIELLRSNPALRFFIVAHLTGPESLDVLLQRSSRRAQAVRAALIEAGIDRDRLEARGIGPLAPACNVANCAQRVELVLQ